ncbi:hypothetical protein Pmar_PMAR022366 [Perkinsus marinus ATCC 50983]|uniref:Uncharacterized protein n=1 Tax=Perkinsus marinus (strain ATCC 50983 / TXsc) TaxID=423536 RepID=C5KDW0_PERM5|nr:hypothetical protein Pmar_PMAR022366 [Perkinsus marinus ATCC 50983]EER17413.1 hypothetical protein Pmar_PMAR022366 [Perkinsus marinus ATCC 50983]|eukprot:XP_002785617.1 hypothetical protein Pmar_PMAR022366 [Perkinsus marinus ATCC 50983]
MRNTKSSSMVELRPPQAQDLEDSPRRTEGQQGNRLQLPRNQSHPGWVRDYGDDSEGRQLELSEAVLKMPFFDVNRFKVSQKPAKIQNEVSKCVLCRAMLLDFGVDNFDNIEKPMRQSELCRLHDLHYVRLYLYQLILSGEARGAGRQKLKQLRAKAADRLEALERPLITVSYG